MRSLWQYRELTRQLLRQEIQELYRGTILGAFWTVLAPFLDLLVYSYVFSVLFHARVSPPVDVETQMPFGLILLAGLLPYDILSRVISVAPVEVLQKPNYVKKVRFPLEVLPVVRLGVAFFQGSVALGVLLVGAVYFTHRLWWTVILLPLMLLPLTLLALGLGWLLAALGVYFRDLQSMMGILLRIWFFATPIVYPLSSVPRWALPIVQANPLTFVVQAVRDVLLWGRVPSIIVWLLWSGLTAGIAFLGYWWFEHTKQGFADVM